MVVNTPHPEPGTEGPGRREFLYLAATTVGLVGAGAAAWTLIDSLNPAADLEAPMKVDVSAIEPGQATTVVWHNKPIFIRHRTVAEINEAGAVNIEDLRDPESDANRVQRPEWIVVFGNCTHLGCLLLGQKPGVLRGEYGGWICPCSGSHFDTSGRVRKGLAPKNLPIPPYRFLDNRTIAIGTCWSAKAWLPCGTPGQPLSGSG